MDSILARWANGEPTMAHYRIVREDSRMVVVRTNQRCCAHFSVEANPTGGLTAHYMRPDDDDYVTVTESEGHDLTQVLKDWAITWDKWEAKASARLAECQEVLEKTVEYLNAQT